MPTDYERLLTEPDAQRVLLTEVTLWNGTEDETFYLSDRPWRLEPSENPPNQKYEPRLLGGFNEEAGLSFSGEIISGVGAPTRAALEFINRDGGLEAWRHYSADGRAVRQYMVGRLRDGTVVPRSASLDSPLFDGLGDRVLVGTQKAVLHLRDGLHRLRRPVQALTYSPPCPEFPGTSGGCIDFGDVLDRTGTFSWEGWVYLSSVTSGTIVSKDSGTAGWGVSIGAAGSGSVRFYCREQTPVNTDTATGLLQLLTWYHIAVVLDTAAQTRKIYINRALQVTSSGVTGSPAGNATSLKLGPNLSGRISRCAMWSTARTLSEIEQNMYLPFVGTETGLVAYWPLDDEPDATVADHKSGGTSTGTLGAGVTWETAEWAGASLVGRDKPRPLGFVQDLEAVPIDPAKNIFQVSGGSIVAVTATRSNHATASTSSVDTARGVITLAGAAGGKITNDVAGDVWLGGAGLFDGVDDRGTAGDSNDQTGSFTLAAMIRPDDLVNNAFGRLFSKDDGATGWLFSTGASASGALFFFIRGGSAVTSSACLTLRRWCHVAAVYDSAADTMTIYRDGDQVGQTTGATVNPVNTAHTFSIGARHDGASPFKGAMDEAAIFSRALTQDEIRYHMVLGYTGSETGLGNAWSFSEGAGASVASKKAGGNSLTLTGTTWTYSRTAPADLVLSLLTAAGYTSSEIDYVAFARWLADDSSDCGWLPESGEEYQAVIEALSAGTGSYVLRPSTTATITGGIWKAPTGTVASEDAYKLSRDEQQGAELEALDLPRPAYRVLLGYARNHGVVDTETVAGIVTSDPVRYQFATKEWRWVQKQDLNVLGPYPQARALRTQSPYINRADAERGAVRLLALYKEKPEALVAQLRTSALRAFPATEVSLTGARMELDEGVAFRVLRVTREGYNANLFLWRLPT